MTDSIFGWGNFFHIQKTFVLDRIKTQDRIRQLVKLSASSKNVCLFICLIDCMYCLYLSTYIHSFVCVCIYTYMCVFMNMWMNGVFEISLILSIDHMCAQVCEFHKNLFPLPAKSLIAKPRAWNFKSVNGEATTMKDEELKYIEKNQKTAGLSPLLRLALVSTVCWSWSLAS